VSEVLIKQSYNNDLLDVAQDLLKQLLHAQHLQIYNLWYNTLAILIYAKLSVPQGPTAALR